MYPLSLAACFDPLVDERVIGLDVAAETWEGGELDRLGEVVATDGLRVAATANGAGAVWVDGAPEGGPSKFVGWSEGALIQVGADGTVYRDGAALATLEGVRLWAVGEAGVAWASGSALGWVGGESWAQSGVQALAVGDARLLGLVCDGGCVLRAWGEQVEDLMEGEAGGAVAEWEGVAWAGFPADDDAEGAGRACAEDGRCVEGIPGDHLGRHIGGGHVAGEFNKWQVPARARILSLDGGPTLAMEEGAETQPVTLDGRDGLLVVGAPYVAVAGAPAGIVQILRP